MAARFDDSSAFTDRYHIEREVGSGGMARVFLARDLKHDREVAIKVLRPELSSGIGKERFLREIKLAARLMHPHILPLFDSGEDDGALYFVMPYVKGASLRVRLVREGQLPLADALEITRDIAGALDYAHRQGIVHRDIKPENIMIHDGVAMVTDFGIGKALREAGAEVLTQAGVLLGTPAYMSPEQVAGETTLDGRSDIYSLGCVLYEMLTGRSPFTGQSIEAIIAKRLTEPAPPLDSTRETIPNDIRQAVHTALAKEPDDRFATGAEFADALAPRIVETTLSADGRAEPSARSIAVLPFTNMSADPENEYFSDGITEEIINALTQLEGLHVAARTSSFAFKGKTPKIAEVGTTLKVATVLEGSVRKAGSRLRITAQLVNVADGYQMWSERYDREMDDVFAIQDEIATAIADRLKVTFAGTSDEPIVRPATENMEAYQLYLKGRYMWNKRTKDGLEQAVEFFNQAIERDAGYALAYSGLADAYLVIGSYRHMPRSEARRKAREAAEKAIELDETLAEAHTSLGQVLRLERDWRGEEQEYRRAIALNPNYATAHQWYATLLGALGRLDEALSEIRHAEELDPLSPAISVTVGIIYALRRDYDAAIEQFEKTLELDPNFFTPHAWLAQVYVWKHMYEEAIEETRKVHEARPDLPDVLAGMANVYALVGQVEKADELVQEAKDRGADPGVIGVAYIGLGDLDQAFEWLERGFEEDSWILFHLKTHPWFDPIHSDPRYSDLLRRMNLTE